MFPPLNPTSTLWDSETHVLAWYFSYKRQINHDESIFSYFFRCQVQRSEIGDLPEAEAVRLLAPAVSWTFRKDSFGKLAFDYQIKTDKKAGATRGGAACTRLWAAGASSALLENVTDLIPYEVLKLIFSKRHIAKSGCLLLYHCILRYW